LINLRCRPVSKSTRNGTTDCQTQDDATALHQWTADHLDDQDCHEDRKSHTDKTAVSPWKWFGCIDVRTESVQSLAVSAGRTSTPGGCSGADEVDSKDQEQVTRHDRRKYAFQDLRRHHRNCELGQHAYKSTADELSVGIRARQLGSIGAGWALPAGVQRGRVLES
jgi:hypothetical protein